MKCQPSGECRHAPRVRTWYTMGDSANATAAMRMNAIATSIMGSRPFLEDVLERRDEPVLVDGAGHAHRHAASAGAAPHSLSQGTLRLIHVHLLGVPALERPRHDSSPPLACV